jgi:GntR family transcriptional regulator
LLASKYGLSVSKGHRTIQAVRASREDAKLMGIKAGSPTLLLKSIGLLQDGTPLEYFVARHRGDRSIFSVRLAR